MADQKKIVVGYYGPVPHGFGNVVWRPRFSWREGHPCWPNPQPTHFCVRAEDQQQSDDPLGRLRARGYIVSCFPEGDGFAFKLPDGVSNEQAASDMRECFGWDVRIRRDS